MVSKAYLAFSNEYDNLIMSLRSAYANDLSVDRTQSLFTDSLDGLRLCLKEYNITSKLVKYILNYTTMCLKTVRKRRRKKITT